MDTPLTLVLDAHHQLVGLAVPERVPTDLWALQGGLGFQGTRPTRVPAHRRLVRSTHTIAWLLGEHPADLDALEARLPTTRPGVALTEGPAVGLVLPLAQAEALVTLIHRWSRGDLAVLPARNDEPATWAIASRVSPQRRADLLQQQRRARRLNRAAERTGIVAELQAAGMPVRQLTPVWDDPVQEKGLAFRLEPTDPRQAVPGLYRASELRAWLTHTGPVVPDPELRREEARHEGIVTNLLARLNHAGVAVLRLRAAWIGQADQRTLGYLVVPAPGHEAALPEGLYSWRALQSRFPLPSAPAASALHDLRQHLRRLRR